MSRKICVFCGSRTGVRDVYGQAAAELGRTLAEQGMDLIYGGGDVGLMGIVAGSALEAGAEVWGIIPRRLLDREVAKAGLTRLLVTETMFERKERMIAEADGFVVLPGGFGTLDELLEVLTLRQLGYHDKPVVLLDIAGFWGPCVAFFRTILREGFADRGSERLFTVVPDVASALAELVPAVRATAAGA